MLGILTGPGRFGSKPPWTKLSVEFIDEASSNNMCYVGLVVDLVHAESFRTNADSILHEKVHSKVNMAIHDYDEVKDGSPLLISD